MRAAAAVIRGIFVVAILVGPLVAGAAEAGFDVLVSASLVRCGAQARALFTTIQDGVNAAGPGERVGVCPGTYVEEVVVGTAGITIQGIGVVQVVAPAGPGPR